MDCNISFSCLMMKKVAILILCFLALSPTLYAQKQFIYDSKGKRDPFMPLVTSDGRIIKLDTEDSSTGVWVEGIIYDKDGLSYAIVNRMVVKIGDIVNDYQVLKIEKNKVIFVKEGQIHEVNMEKEAE